MASKPLKFKVAPHIVEDLGLNLYTSLPRVLVEFVANAHDADSDFAKVTLDKREIDKARTVLKQQFKVDVAEATDGVRWPSTGGHRRKIDNPLWRKPCQAKGSENVVRFQRNLSEML